MMIQQVARVDPRWNYVGLEQFTWISYKEINVDTRYPAVTQAGQMKMKCKEWSIWCKYSAIPSFDINNEH